MEIKLNVEGIQPGKDTETGETMYKVFFNETVIPQNVAEDIIKNKGMLKVNYEQNQSDD